MFRTKKILLSCISLILFLLIIIGVSYSYFIKNDEEVFDLNDVDIVFLDDNKSLSLDNIQPMNDELGMNFNQYLDFKIVSKKENTIYYEIIIVNDKDNAFDNKYLKVYLTDQNNQEISDIKSYSELENFSSGKIIYKGDLVPKEEKDLRLRLWIDENYKELSLKKANYSIKLYVKN